MIFWPADAIQVKSLSSQKRLKKRIEKRKALMGFEPMSPRYKSSRFYKIDFELNVTLHNLKTFIP